MAWQMACHALTNQEIGQVPCGTGYACSLQPQRLLVKQSLSECAEFAPTKQLCDTKGQFSHPLHANLRRIAPPSPTVFTSKHQFDLAIVCLAFQSHIYLVDKITKCQGLRYENFVANAFRGILKCTLCLCRRDCHRDE